MKWTGSEVTFRQKKFLVCVNIPGNKTVSDSDSDSEQRGPIEADQGLQMPGQGQCGPRCWQ